MRALLLLFEVWKPVRYSCSVLPHIQLQLLFTAVRILSSVVFNILPISLFSRHGRVLLKFALWSFKLMKASFLAMQFILSDISKLCAMPLFRFLVNFIIRTGRCKFIGFRDVFPVELLGLGLTVVIAKRFRVLSAARLRPSIFLSFLCRVLAAFEVRLRYVFLNRMSSIIFRRSSSKASSSSMRGAGFSWFWTQLRAILFFVGLDLEKKNTCSLLSHPIYEILNRLNKSCGVNRQGGNGDVFQRISQV